MHGIDALDEPLSQDGLTPYSPQYGVCGIHSIPTRIDVRPMSSSRPPPTTWAPGAVIPGTIYRVIRPLGSGGMGDVYEAEHELLGVRRALKVLSRKMAGREDLAERLRIEARALAKLRHPNLVQVHDLGVSSDGRVFFAMDLLEGATLRDLLRRLGRLKPEQAIAIATQVLDALGAAHEQGMVHRDVKPENIFVLSSGTIKLLDFGVAKAMQGTSLQPQLTAAGMAVGTPRYMAPEQAEGKPVDARSDLYGVGIVLWEMLAGHPPYHQLDAVAAAIASVTRGIPPLQREGVDAPSALTDVITRATARLRDDRYPDATSFSAELRLARPRCSLIPASNDKKTLRYDEATTSLMPIINSDSEDDEAVLDRLLESNERTSQLSVQTHELLSLESLEGLTEIELAPPVDPGLLPTPTSIEIAARPSTIDALPSHEEPAPKTHQTRSSRQPTQPLAMWMVVPAVAMLTAFLTAWVVRAPADEARSARSPTREQREDDAKAAETMPLVTSVTLAAETMPPAVTSLADGAAAGSPPSPASASAAPDAPKTPPAKQAVALKQATKSKPTQPAPVSGRAAVKKTSSGLPSSGL